MLPRRTPRTAFLSLLAAAVTTGALVTGAPAGASAAPRAETVSTSTDPRNDVSIDQDRRGLSERDRRSIDLERLVVRRLGGGGLSLVVDLARLAPRDARWDQLVTVRLTVPGTGEDGGEDGEGGEDGPDDTYGVFVTSDPGQDPQVASDVAGQQQCDATVQRRERAARLRVKVPAACAAPARARGSLQVTTRDLDRRDLPAWSGDRMRVRPLRGS